MTFETTSAGVLFPSARQDSGQCANALVELLIANHNLVVDSFAGELHVRGFLIAELTLFIAISIAALLFFSQENTSLVLPTPILAGDELHEAQLVVYDEDALNLILIANSEYILDVNKAQQITWEPKTAGFEADVVEKFMLGRPKIEPTTRPRFVFQNDELGGGASENLATKIPQELLSSRLKAKIEKELGNLVDVCDLLQKVVKISYDIRKD